MPIHQSGRSRETILRPKTPMERQRWSARIRATSPTGAYLLANKKVAVGSRLRLRIPNHGPVNLRITSCDPQPTGGWALACIFLAEPDEQALNLLLPPPGPLDQRHWARLSCSSLARYRVVGTLQEDEGWARLADISPRGARLVAERPLPQGAIVQLELGVGDSVFTIARVAYARQQPSQGWTVGCFFQDKLADDDLWRLLSDAG